MTEQPMHGGFREYRTRQQIAALLRFGHIIPVSKGYTDAHVAEHFPGWTWNELMAVWHAAAIVVRRDGGMSTCDERVEAVAFNDPDDLVVEWTDGSTTRRSPN